MPVLLVVRELAGLEVGVEPHDVRVALQEAGRRPGDDARSRCRRRPAGRTATGRATRVSRTPSGRDSSTFSSGPGALAPAWYHSTSVELDADLVVQPAAHVDGGGVGPLRRADPLAAQVLGGLDAAAAVHVERAEPEDPGADDRQADDVRLVPGHLGGELGDGQLGDVPLAVRGEAGEHLVVAEHRPDVLDPLRPHGAEPEVAEVVVVGGGDAEPEHGPITDLAVWIGQSVSPKMAAIAGHRPDRTEHGAQAPGSERAWRRRDGCSSAG